ncbi:beta-N-acetylglucosaminidase domain-containing protein [Streptomyces sp. H27-C3]|uniref:beta-N-acetylglucosaminidase domain-containing protein n=1 Tax=Streptomyces sp. H27-C3 TaxID=3046305 RepID=UPI0024B94F44|nr:beta-N-acetylglucosaminidase domain-containing protein [Streptomyces sp. H27-C3]MDJ0462465.1 beta-N-acetylglucosaminidase domain-containing protein [Streptomyces sp. H27-C3]
MLRRRRLATLATALSLVLGVPTVSAVADPPDDNDRRSTSVITPTPQDREERNDRATVTATVTLVAGAQADAAALAVTQQALRDAGATKVVRGDRPVQGRLTVYVGGPAETPQSATALTGLGIAGPTALPAEGYVLGIGDRAMVLAGKNATGTYYAAQSLRQVLPESRRSGSRVDGIEVRDWPTTPIRGVIEGFYGIPWTHAARLDQLDFYGEHKMNIFVYSPKDDPYLREQWREPYPAAQLAKIRELVGRSRARHVEFTYALSPGLSACYSSEADIKALTDKFQTVWDLGARTFAVPLDDINHTAWNCQADRDKWGTGAAAAGAAQSYFLNRVNRGFIATHPGAEPLQMVPTEYASINASPYKKAIAAQLDPDIVVEWTGVGVIAPVITVAQARTARQVFAHPILLWDNYPVNDYVTNRLLLGPYNGREKGMPAELGSGITANPMNQAYASKIPLITVADYSWNDAAYDPRRSWLTAIDEYAGGDARTGKALRIFSDVNYSSRIQSRQAPALTAEIARFWQSGNEGRLDGALADLQRSPDVLRERLPEQEFINDSDPWLDSAEAWGVATRSALKLVETARDGEGEAAWKLRQRLPSLVAKAKSFVYVDLEGDRIPVTVGEGVLDKFVEDAAAEHDRLLGVTGRIKGLTNLPAYQGNGIDRMLDGSDATFFWSSRAVAVGDHVTVDLRKEREIGDIRLAMAKPGNVNDYLRQGVLEYSSDGTDWRQLTAVSATPDVTVTAPAGTMARYVRARATARQTNWLVVREFSVQTRDSAVSGGPPAATASSLRAAADGDVESVYRAERTPQSGEALQVDLGGARTAKSVVVLQPEGAVVRAAVQVRAADGSWRTVGQLARGYQEFRIGTAAFSAVRLLWRAGTGAPRIAEVVVR